MRHILFLVFSFCSLFCLQLFSQEAAIIKLIDSQKGLSNGRVTSIVQDSIGFIWIGTKNGLNRYDGSSIKIYNTKNSFIGSNDISLLKRDSKNRFWVGTIGKGIFLYDIKKDYFKGFNTASNINTIYEDSNNVIWLGTNEGLFFYDKKRKKFSKSQNLNNNKNFNITSIIEYKDHQLLIGTKGDGLLVYNKNLRTLKPFSFNKKLQSDFINVLYKLNAEELLIGTNGKGLLKLNKRTEEVVPYFAHKIKSSIIRSIYKDAEENFWVGTDGQGVYKIVKTVLNETIKVFHYFKDNKRKYSLNNNTVNSIFQDNQKNIWIGTAWNGVNIIERSSEKAIFYFSDFYGENPSPVLSIFKKKNKIWVGTDGNGFSIIDIDKKAANKNKTLYFLEKEYVQVIKESKKGNYWIGTFANGLVSFNAKKGATKRYVRSSDTANTLPYNDVRDIIEEENGDLWIATWGGGLSNFNYKEKIFTNYQHNKELKNSISSNDVLAISKNALGNLWIATWGEGLNYFDQEKQIFLKYSLEKESSFEGSNFIFSLKKDVQNNLWLGTKKGLIKFDPIKKSYEKIKIGFTDNSNAVVSLLIDRQVVWMGTKDGIYSYNTITKKVLLLNDFKGEYHINSAFKDKEGFLYFGGTDGFIRFNPKIIAPKKKPTVLTFTDFKIFNKSVAIKNSTVLKHHISFEKKLNLNYNQNVITFDFSSLQLPFSKTLQYQVKMDGFENEWRTIEIAQTATYTNLSPGAYTFNVRNKNADDSWGKAISIDLVIRPPYWKTLWAYGLYFVLLSVFLVFLRKNIIDKTQIKNRLEIEKHKREQQDKLHQIKQQFFSNISHEIRTPLALIMNSVNVLKKEKQESGHKKSISTIRNNTKRLINLVNELLNYRKLETGNFELNIQKTNIISLVKDVFLAFSQEAIIKKISYKFLHKKEEINVWVDRVQFEKVIFNLLSNAFKFTSKKDKISITILMKENHIEILVQDTGKGISVEMIPHIFKRFYHTDYKEANAGFGIGLSIVKEIVTLHSGNITVNSVLDKGATFTVIIPLGKNHFKKKQLKLPEIDKESIEYKNEIDLEEFKNKKILLIEDNKHLRSYLKKFLSKSYKIIEASNGEKGLKKTLEHYPDIVISDVMMPKMDGFSFCHQLKTDPRISHIPVILLTARALDVDKIEGLSNGADDYLIKPFNEELLQVKINAILKNRKLLHQKFSKNSILTPKELILTSTDEVILKKIVNLLEKNIDNSEFNIDELAKEIGMSHSNLYKKMKAITGMTIVGFVRDFRLQRAAQLFRTQKISIVDASFMVGYTDRKYFSQEFKKKFKVTPSVYIKENNKEN